MCRAHEEKACRRVLTSHPGEKRLLPNFHLPIMVHCIHGVVKVVSKAAGVRGELEVRRAHCQGRQPTNQVATETQRLPMMGALPKTMCLCLPLQQPASSSSLALGPQTEKAKKNYKNL